MPKEWGFVYIFMVSLGHLNYLKFLISQSSDHLLLIVGNGEALDLELVGLGLIRGFIFTGKSLDLTLPAIVPVRAQWVGHLGLLFCHSWRLNACSTGNEKTRTVLGPAWPLRVCRY